MCPIVYLSIQLQLRTTTDLKFSKVELEWPRFFNTNEKGNKRTQYLYLPPDIREIIEPLPRQVKKLPPLVALSRICPTRPVHELQNQRPPRANVRPARQEITANECLKYAWFPTALAAHNRHLRKINRGRTSELREDILELIYDRDHWASDRPSRRELRRWCDGGLLLRHPYQISGAI